MMSAVSLVASAVGAERDVDAGVEQLPHGADAAAELQVGEGIVGDRAAALGEQLDVAPGQPDRVIHREARRQHADLVEMLDERPAIERLAGHRLRLGLEDMGVHRQVVARRELGRAAQQLLAAALWPRGRRDDPDPPGRAVPRPVVALEQRDLLAGGRRWRAVELGREVGRHEVAQEWHAVEERPVPHRDRDHRAQPRIAIGFGRAIERLGLGADHQQIVLDRRDPAADRFDRADHGPQIVLTLGQPLAAERRIAVDQPQLERQIVVGALLEALVRMHVRVDQARQHDPPPRVDHLDRQAPAARRGARPAGPTQTIRSPSIRTSPGSYTLPAASPVTTCPAEIRIAMTWPGPCRSKLPIRPAQPRTW